MFAWEPWNRPTSLGLHVHGMVTATDHTPTCHLDSILTFYRCRYNLSVIINPGSQIIFYVATYLICSLAGTAATSYASHKEATSPDTRAAPLLVKP